MQTCQTQSTACFSQVYGGPGPNAVTVKKDNLPPDATPVDPNAAQAAVEEEQPAQKAKPTKKAKSGQARAERRQQ